MNKHVNGAEDPNMVVGVFSTLAGAEAAVRQLAAIGLSANEVSVISSNDVVKKHFERYRPEAEPEDWKEAAILGGSVGAILAGVTSVAWGGSEPGVAPPMSPWWVMLALKATMRSWANIGMTTAMSGACVPPA